MCEKKKNWQLVKGFASLWRFNHLVLFTRFKNARGVFLQACMGAVIIANYEAALLQVFYLP